MHSHVLRPLSAPMQVDHSMHRWLIQAIGPNLEHVSYIAHKSPWYRRRVHPFSCGIFHLRPYKTRAYQISHLSASIKIDRASRVSVGLDFVTGLYDDAVTRPQTSIHRTRLRWMRWTNTLSDAFPRECTQTPTARLNPQNESPNAQLVWWN